MVVHTISERRTVRCVRAVANGAIAEVWDTPTPASGKKKKNTNKKNMNMSKNKEKRGSREQQPTPPKHEK